MKFMNMKRFASTVMAGALTMSLAVPAFAADSQTVITATYAETALDVVVPANTNATINPYGLPVTMDGWPDDHFRPAHYHPHSADGSEPEQRCPEDECENYDHRRDWHDAGSRGWQ